MSLEEAVSQMAELRVSSDAMQRAQNVGGLAVAIEQMILMRNSTVNIEPQIIAARRAILDPAIVLLKAKLKKEMRELIPILEQWEELPPAR